MSPLASNEADRLAALRALRIVDTPEEAHFNAVCRLVRDVFAVPIALISFVEEDRQWFKAKCGLSADGTSRDVAFCTYAILSDDVMVVEDATADPRFADNPLVQAEHGVRFYAGAPLILRPGIHVGTLCIKDTRPRSLSDEQVRQLRDLAEIVVAHLRLHEANNRQKQEIVAREEHQNFILSQAKELGQREAALRETNRLLLMAEQMAHAGHWRLGLPSQHRVWSDEVYRIFGLDPQMDTPNLTDTTNGYHPDDQSRVRDILANAAVTKADFCFEARIVRPTSEVRDVVVRGTYDAVGTYDQGALMGVIIDITEFNRAQARLRETEQQFRLAIDGMTDYAIIMLDPKGCVATWNAGAQRIMGYTVDEIVGRHFSRFYTDEDQAAGKPHHALQTAVGTGRFETESWRICKSGKLFWANVVIEPFCDDAGTLIGFSKVTRDNTERRTSETKLLASEARYRALADALPQIVWVMRAEDGEASYVNQQFEAYFGSIGASAAARLARNHPSDAERLEPAWGAVQEGRTVEWEGRLLRHDGVFRWHKLVIVPVRREGEIVEWFGTALDIDDIVTARNKLEETTDLLRLAQEAARAGVWEWELGPGIVRLSPESATMHGVEGASEMSQDVQVEMTVKNWEAHVHPDDLVHVQAEAKRAIEQRGFFSAEFRVAHPQSQGDSFRWLQSFGRVLFDPDSDEPSRFVGLDLDITERKEADVALLLSKERLKASEERLAHALDSGSDGLWDWDLTTNDAWFSDRWHRMLGYEKNELEHHLRTWERVAHPEDAERAVAAMRAHLKGFTPFYECEYRLRRKDGTSLWVLVRGKVVSRTEEGRALRVVGTQIDITRRKEAEEAQRLSEERLALALDSGSDGLWDWCVTTGEIKFFGQWFRTLGYDPGEIECNIRNWISLVHPDDADTALRLMTEHFKGRMPLYECEYRLKTKTGAYLWTLARGKVVSRAEDGRALRMVGTYINITERKKSEQQIAHMAVHDALTGLPNRVLFRDRLEHEIASSERNDCTFAVLACDLDSFKVVNDTMGHPAGDTLLGIVAERLKSVVRHGDTVARLGGDEFAIILSRLEHPQEASVIAQRVIEVVGQSIDLDGRPTNVGISIGIAAGADNGANADHLFKHADIALYRAKAGGRNTYRFYEAGMDAAVAARNLLQLDMREALNQGGFTLHYQPIMNLSSNATGGFEALLRWQHPTRGAISPAEFIPLAEQTGLIVSLGDWALREACREAASWPDHLRIAVNVSAIQFQQPGLEQSVLVALATSGLRANRLELEITESVLLADADAVIASLHRLRALGVRIALDDFGTGYSSLSYLRGFPFDKIKIDRSFIREIADPDTAAIVRAVVGLGARLGTAITAEGVETNEQLELVRQEGCTEVQGFLFSRPLPAADALIFACSKTSRVAA